MVTGGAMLSELPDEAIDAALEAAAGSTLLQVDFRHLGGALAERDPDGGALPALPGDYALAAVGAVMGPVTVEMVESDLAKVIAALEPWNTGATYSNFNDRPNDGSSSFAVEDYERLRAVKRQADPRCVIRGAQEIEPAR